MSENQPVILTIKQSTELAEALLDLDAGSIGRGTRYFNQGRVGVVRWDAQAEQLSATVEGTSTYQTRWAWDGRFWESSCTCPLGGSCKHAFALGKKALEQAVSGETAGDGTSVSPKKPAPVALVPLLEQTHGRALKPAEKRTVKQIEDFHRDSMRSGTIAYDRIVEIARPTNPMLSGASDTTIDEVAQVFERGGEIRTACEFWLHLALVFKLRGWQVPSFLVPISDTSELEVRVRERREAAEREKWERMLVRLGEGSARRGVVGASGDMRLLRVRLRTKGVVFETAKADGVFTEIGFREVGERIRSGELSPRSSEWDLASVALAALFEDAGFMWFHKPQLRNAEIATAVGQALAHPHLRDRVVGDGGEPFRHEEAPLTWKFEDESEMPGRCNVMLVQADGSPAPRDLLHLGGPPHLYLSSEAVWMGPAPLSDRGGAGWKASLPVSVFRNTAVVRTLVQAGARLPESVAARVETVDLRPLVRGRLAREVNGTEVVRFSLLGIDQTDTPRLLLGPGGWMADAPGIAKSGSEDRVAVHRTEGLVATVAHFASQAGRWDPTSWSWGKNVHGGTPSELYGWLAGFPREAIVELAPELAGLRAPPVRADFSLQIEESDRDWFDVQLVVRSEDTAFTAEELALLLAGQGRWVRLDKHGWQRLALAADDEQREKLDNLGLGTDGALPGRQRFHALQLAGAQLDESLAGDAWKRVQERASAIRALPPPPVPEGFVGDLRPYQQEGFHFLVHLASNSLGGILADDMGLGKTVQAIAWMLWLAQRQPADHPLRVLVVCPKSVTTNWERETQRFAPTLSVERFVGGRAYSIPDTQIVVANYAQLRNAERLFLSVAWTAVILDEAQNIKNPQSQTAGIARKLAATHRLVLTGTPIENRVLDLWSLFAFAMPGLLGGQSQFARLYNDKKDPEARGRLARRVRHFLLRRTKAQVAADLPPRTEEDVYCELEGDQEKLYQVELKRARQLVLGVSDDRALDAQRFNILQSLLRLRQICCHPGLVNPEFSGAASAKVAALFDLLEPILDEGHKVLVFSQFVSALEILQRELAARDVPHLVLTGKTENRQELVDRFQKPDTERVFLLSLKAAGSGLNLTAASYVVLFDPWWNPAVEAQAIDRTHRIGQVAQVNAYRILAKDTVEEKIRALQREKAALAQAVVQEESLAQVLDLESLRYVLS
jgi:superfamily II DNA or RNA helicase